MRLIVVFLLLQLGFSLSIILQTQTATKYKYLCDVSFNHNHNEHDKRLHFSEKEHHMCNNKSSQSLQTKDPDVKNTDRDTLNTNIMVHSTTFFTKPRFRFDASVKYGCKHAIFGMHGKLRYVPKPLHGERSIRQSEKEISIWCIQLHMKN